MSAGHRRFLVGPSALVVLAASFAPSPVQAAALTVDSSIERPRVGVADVVNYSIVLHSDGELPSVNDALPGRIDGFELVGTSSYPQHSIVMRNGVVERRTALTVTFRLRATSVGPHVIGPGRFVLPSGSMTAPTVRVEVVPAGTAPTPPMRGPGGLFDPFDDPFFRMNDLMQEPSPPPSPKDDTPSDPLAQLDAPPADAAERFGFVRVAFSSRKAVVGEPLLAKLFVYSKAGPRISTKRPPGFTDFQVIDLNQADKEWRDIRIGGERWKYAAVSTYAVFPLRTGALRTDSAEVTFTQESMFNRAAPLDRKSPVVDVNVTEPPAAGRPPGYVVGDVASGLELVAEVSPRVVVDGHALVSLRMKAEGRLDTLRPELPVLPGLTFTMTGDEARTVPEGFTVRGTRRLTYDLRFDKTGSLALGDAKVVVWDFHSNKYAIVSAPLGSVQVERTAPAAPAAAVAPLPPPRTMEGPRGEGTTLASARWPWLLLFGAPVSVLALQGTWLGVGNLLRRRALRRARKTERAWDEFARARSAERAGKQEGVLAASVRALELALEEQCNVRARGLVARELRDVLGKAALSPTLVDGVVDLLAQLDAARFAGGARPPLSQVESVLSRLLRGAS